MSFHKRRAPNWAKICAFATCKSDGRYLPKDTDVSFIPFPKPCPEYRDEEIEFLLQQKSGERSHKTAECSRCSRALMWISLCQRSDNRLKMLSDITSASYVCSNHFLDCGPSERYPDPFPADVPPEEVAILRAKNKYRGTGRNLEKPANQLMYLTKQPTTVAISENLRNDDNILTISVPELRSSCASSTVVPTKCSSTITEVKNEGACCIAVQTDANVTTDACCQVPNEKNMMSFALEQLILGWACIIKDTSVNFMKYDEDMFSCLMEVRVHHTTSELTCELYVLGQSPPVGSDLFTEQEKVKSCNDLEKFMQLLNKSSLCNGITKKELKNEFSKLTAPTSGKFCYRTTAVRAVKCRLVTCGVKCVECTKYERNLRHLLQERLKKEHYCHKCCNNRNYLSAEKLVAKAKLCAARNKGCIESMK